MKKAAMLGGIVSGILCVLCILAYTYFVYKDADSARAEAMSRYGGEQVEVVVASRDLYPGEMLSGSNTTKKLWVSDLLPEEALTNTEDVQGQQLSSTVLKGEVVSAKRFHNDAVDIEIPQGKVALSVPAKDVQAVGGAISAGSYVNVYATGTQTTCLDENVLVLATNTSGSDDSSAQEQVSWVTLAINPEKSQEYVTASQSMDIYFALPAVAESSKEEG